MATRVYANMYQEAEEKKNTSEWNSFHGSNTKRFRDSQPSARDAVVGEVKRTLPPRVAVDGPAWCMIGLAAGPS
jgi:hypothetical protein